MASPSTSFKGSISEATGSMRSPLSSFTSRSPWILTSTMPSPVSSRLTLEFETAFSMEAEEPIRFSSTDILPYLSQASSRSCSSSSEFDTQSEAESRSTSFCDFNDSRRITLGSLIGLPMDSFRHFGESFRLIRANSSHPGSTNAAPARRSRTCSLLFDLLRCLQRTRADYVHFKAPVARPNLGNLTSFTITEVSEEEERDDSESSDVGPTVFENSVFVERDTLGSRIYEFNPLYISDAISEADPTEVRDLSLPRGGVASTPGDDDVKKKNPEKNRVASTLGVDDNVMKNPEKNLEKNGNTGSDSGTVRKAESSSLSVQVRSSQIPRLTTTAIVSRSSQPLSPMRSVLSTVCCQLGEFSDVECPSD